MNSTPPSSRLLPRLPERAGPGDVLAGAALLFRAVSIMVGSRKLVGWSLLSSFITAGTLVGLAAGAWSGSAGWAQALVHAQSTWGQVGEWLLRVLLFVVAFAVGALTVPNVVLSPLQDPLSEATEALYGLAGGATGAGAMVRGTLSSLKHTLARLLLMAAGMVVLLPLHLVPGLGSVLWLVLTSLWSALWVAVEHLSTPAARHGWGFRELLRRARQRPGAVLGLGGALSVLLWVPVVNFFLLPVAVCSGTLLYLCLFGTERPPGTQV